MPQVIPYIAAVAIKNIYWKIVVTIVATVAVNAYERDRAAEKARRAYNASLQDRLITVRSGVSPRHYVLGLVRTGGTLMYADTVGENKEALDTVIAFAGNRCDLIRYVFNDEHIPVAAFPGQKYGKKEIFQILQGFSVTGPTVSVDLDQRPLDGEPIVVAWSRASPKATGLGTGVMGVGTTLDITGLPADPVTLSITYKINSSDKLRAVFKDGDPDQIVTNWPGYSTPTWTAEHRLRGVTYLRTLMIWDENIWANGAPNITAVLRGGWIENHPFYDPRTGTNPTFTDNPAILAGWWMTLERRRGGCGIPSDWIDWSAIGVAANICDELVTVSTGGGSYEQIKRYTCNTVLSAEHAPEDNLKIILSAMAGRKCFTAGKYRIVAGAFRPAIVTITDADIVGTKPISVLTANATDPPPNIVTATFSDLLNQYAETSPSPVVNQDYVTQDGHETTLDLRMDATTDARQAHYLMGVALETARPAFGITLTVGGLGEDLAIFDSVQLNLTNRPSYAGRTFEIVAITDSWNGQFELTLSEIKATTWALDPDTFTPLNPTELPNLDYLWNVPKLTGFQVLEVAPTLLPDGTTLSRIELGWDPPPVEGIAQGGRIELRYRKADGEWIGIPSVPGDATRTTVTAALIDDDIYQFQARAVNSIGAAGDWADAWEQVTGIPLPQNKAIRLRATSFIFRVPPSGSGTVSPASITLTLDRQGGLVAASTWETTPVITLTGTGDSRVLTYANMTEDAVRIDVEVEEDNVLYLDTITIVKLYDGADSPDYIPDPTAPPSPTGLIATPAIFHIILEWDAPTYTEGHGHASTEVYAALVPSGGPQPTFASATLIGGTPARVFSHDVGTGQAWAYWIKHKSIDGVLSVTPTGGTNGVQATTGKVGNIDLGASIVEAANLASGAVTADKVATGAIAATKFATGIEPITNVVSVPLTRATNAIFNTTDGKLYRWNGSAYVATILTTDLAGQLTDAQIAAIDAAKLTGQITSTQIANDAITSPKIAANAVTASEIAAGAVIAGKIAASAVTATELAAGSVIAGKVAASAITATELAANSVVAGKIAAGAVNATAIAAGAITTEKLLVTGRGAALNDDPGTIDPSAWSVQDGAPTLEVGNVSSVAPGGHVIRITNPGGAKSRSFPLVAGKIYHASCWARKISGTGGFYLRVYQFDAAGTLLAASIGVEHVTVGASFTRYSGNVALVAGAVSGYINVTANWTGTGVTDVADIRCEEAIPGELIVDGAITATKLSANAIVAGSAAIGVGAISNAMIATAAIDDAKIASLSAAKITFGEMAGARIQAGTITADRLAILSAAGTSIDMSNGRIVFNNGAYMRVTGTGFGTAGQFLDWYGPALGSVALCSESNASWYLKTNGQSYFGGALSANIAKNSVVSTNTAADASVILGPFATIGNPKQVSVSYSFTRVGTRSGTGGVTGGPASATISIERRTGGGAFVVVASSPLSATETFFEVQFDGFNSSLEERMAGSLTFTDSGTGTQDHEYRATITSRTIRTLNANWVAVTINQDLVILSVENLS